jgi:hypothetical protein
VYNGKTLFFPNIVQAYCFTSDPEGFLRDKNRFFRQRWFPSMKQMIIRKIQNIIQYVKEADGCLTAEPGSLFKGAPDRLLAGRENLPNGFKGPSVTRLKGNVARRVSRLQRAPSFETILAATPEEERIIAFTAEPYRGYSINVDKLGSNSNSNSAKKKSRKKKGVNENDDEDFESENVARAENAMNAALAAAGAGAGPAPFLEARGDFIEAVAQELAAEELANAARNRAEEEGEFNAPAPEEHQNNNVGLPLEGGRRRGYRQKTRKFRKN